MTMHRKRKEDAGELASEFAVEKLPRKYSVAQLKEFGARIKEFYEEREVASMKKDGTREKIQILNHYEAAVAFGAMRKKTHLGKPTYAVIMEENGGDREGRTTYKTPNRYEIFMDKLEQWNFLEGKKDFAIAKETEHYETMAEQAMSAMRFTPDVPEPDLHDHTF